MQWLKRSSWLVRSGFIAAAVCCAGAAGSQSLFDRAPIGFTQPQAQRGQRVYAESCALCHGPHLNDGQFGPPVKGTAFKARWHDQAPEALWSAIIKRMPPASPGSLDGRAATDVENLPAAGRTAKQPGLRRSSPPARRRSARLRRRQLRPRVPACCRAPRQRGRSLSCRHRPRAKPCSARSARYPMRCCKVRPPAIG